MSADKNKRFLFTELRPGVRPHHLLTFYFAAFITVGLAVLLSVLQPFLLEAFLEIPRAEQGGVTGTATVIGEIVLLCVIGAWGAASDKVGRRRVYVAGIFIVGIAYALHPFVSSTFHLYIVRGVYALGMAAASGMLATLVGDYVVNRDRGKANGFMGVCNAMGAAIAATLLAKLPVKLRETYIDSGMDITEAANTAGWKTYLAIAVFTLVGALILRIGLAGRDSTKQVDRIPFSQRMKEGWAAGKEDKITGLSYVTAFVARADLAIAGLFVPLWCSLYIQENPAALGTLKKYQCAEGSEDTCTDMAGATCTPGTDGCLIADGSLDAFQCMNDGVCLSLAGMERAGILIAMIGAGSLMAAPFIGILTDKINRITAVAIALSINVIGYGLTFFVDDPFSTNMLFVAMLIGAGEVAGIITTQSLIQQQAPEKSRGSVIGFFSFCGGLGILINSYIGGQVFDSIAFNAPFVWIAGLNLVVVFACLIMRKKKVKQESSSTDSLSAK